MRALDDYRAYWRDQCIAANGSIEDGPIVRLRGPAGAFPINGVLQFTGTPDEATAEARRWVAQGMPCSFSCPDPALAPALEAAGMFQFEHFTFVEAPVLDMGSPSADVRMDAPPVDFVAVQAAAHHIPDEGIAGITAGWQFLVEAGKARLAVAYVEDNPVGCMALYTGAGNAGLYGGGVLAAHRRGGIAKSLMQACMQTAVGLGLTRAVGATTSDGHALCQALGFEDVGKLQQFVWFPGPPPGN